MSASTGEMCKCGAPLYVKATASGTGEYGACHHCDRPCGGWVMVLDVSTGTHVQLFEANTSKTCGRCKRLTEWEGE